MVVFIWFYFWYIFVLFSNVLTSPHLIPSLLTDYFLRSRDGRLGGSASIGCSLRPGSLWEVKCLSARTVRVFNVNVSAGSPASDGVMDSVGEFESDGPGSDAVRISLGGAFVGSLAVLVGFCFGVDSRT